LSLCFTKIPYDNNYFFEGDHNLVIVSFYGWDQLTTLSTENGAIYFLAKLLRLQLPLPPRHEDVSGCINDFLWDKTGVDLGMKSGLLCDGCQDYINKHDLTNEQKHLLESIHVLLDDLGNASRNEENIVDYWTRLKD